MRRVMFPALTGIALTALCWTVVVAQPPRLGQSQPSDTRADSPPSGPSSPRFGQAPASVSRASIQPANVTPASVAADRRAGTNPSGMGVQDRGGQIPMKEARVQVLWLIESDDANRAVYDGPAADGLASAGFGRLVIGASNVLTTSVGQRAMVSGTGRYGSLNVSLTLLNTTDVGELQIAAKLQTQTPSPFQLDTTTRVPVGRWVLLGAAETRAIHPTHVQDGHRSVMILRIDPGVLVLQ